MLPVMIQSCVECTYPLSEELSIGWLHNGANLFGVGVIFTVQRLMDISSPAPPPFEPASLLVIALMGTCFLLTMVFNGPYKRLQTDLVTTTTDGNRLDEDGSLIVNNVAATESLLGEADRS